MSKKLHTLRDMGSALGSTWTTRTLRILNNLDIQPVRQILGPGGKRTERFYTHQDFEKVKAWKAEHDARNAAPEPAPEPAVEEPVPVPAVEAAPVPDRAPAVEGAKVAILAFQMRQILNDQGRILSRLDQLASSIGTLQAALDSILDELTRPNGHDMTALLANTDDRPGAN